MTFSNAVRNRVHQRCKGRCGYCGIKLNILQMQIDHIIPQVNYKKDVLSRDRVPEFLLGLGLNDMNSKDNLMPSCKSCNLNKGCLPLEIFRDILGKQLKYLQQNTNYRLAKRYGLIIESPKHITFYFEKKKNV